MTISEQFTTLLERDSEEDALLFLKRLTAAEKKELMPALKLLYKEYLTYSEEYKSSGWQGYKANEGQRIILGTAFFVCGTRKDFENNFFGSFFKRERLNVILPWYCPVWFSDHMNRYVNDGFIPYNINYEWYMELVEQGYVQPNEQMIAMLLNQVIFTSKTPGFDYTPEKLLVRKITLDEHIWYLFNTETGINNNDRWRAQVDKAEESYWITTFKTYTAEGRIERRRLLREAVLAAHKNFNQNLSGWFMELFIKLEPDKDDLLALQNQLLNLLNSPHSKPVNAALKYFKDLAAEPDFEVDAFMDHAPLIMSSETKGAVASALMILEKLAKKYPERQEQICVIASQAFIHQDNALQVRAAKLVQKHGDTASELLKETVAVYFETLFSEARSLLNAFAGETISAESEEEEQHIHIPAGPGKEIRMPQTFDELVFLASQAFDQNETYHFDLLPAALLKFQDEMTEANIVKLAPAFQRAYKLVTSDWTSTKGYLDNMLAKFFIDYGKLLVSFHPTAAEPIRLLHESFLKKEEEKKANWAQYKTTITSIKVWGVATKSTGYTPHKFILINALWLLEKQLRVPLLCAPTHEPAWLSPITLMDRLAEYQNAKLLPATDLQIAIARCAKNTDENALKLVDAKLTGEYRKLMGFILGEEHYPQETYKLKEAWLIAALTRHSLQINSNWFKFSGLTDGYLTGNFNWESKIEPYTWKKYDYQQRKDIEVSDIRKVIRIEFGEKHKPVPTSLKSIFNKLAGNKTQEIEKTIYDYTELKFQWISAEHNDIRRLLYINPNHPELLIAHIINKCLSSPDFSGENDKKMIIYTLETLFTLSCTHGPMAHLLIASAMISNDKGVRTYAAELWIKGITEGTIDNNYIGEIIGKHERIELAPIKRLTDLILSNMFQISPKHNIALEHLLLACIQNMADKPINNVKKLLEIYTEILMTNKSSVKNAQVLERINQWGATESLKKTVMKLNGLGG